MRSLLRLLGDLLDLPRAWWRVDRVRPSPREGRLLRIEPRCLLRVEGRPAEVIARAVEETPDGAVVVYRCLRDGSPCELRAAPRGPRHQLELRWLEAEGERELSEEAVEVFSAPSRRHPLSPGHGARRRE